MAPRRGLREDQRRDAYLWRAVDHEGDVPESFASKTRRKPAVLKFMKKLMKRHGCAKVITTDGLRSYEAARRVWLRRSFGPSRNRSLGGGTVKRKLHHATSWTIGFGGLIKKLPGGLRDDRCRSRARGRYGVGGDRW